MCEPRHILEESQSYPLPCTCSCITAFFILFFYFVRINSQPRDHPFANDTHWTVLVSALQNRERVLLLCA